MALFDELIADLGSRFGFGEKAEALLKELVGLIKDHPDGLSGFLNQFKTAGYGEQAASWLGDTNGAPLSSAQVEKTLGHGVVAAIARKLALDTGAAGAAIGYALPKLVGLLTPDGIVPKALPDSITGTRTAPPRLPQASGAAGCNLSGARFKARQFGRSLGPPLLSSASGRPTYLLLPNSVQ